MRLVIDARMLDHSGIGVYLSHVLPGLVERCAAHSPLVLASPRSLERVRALAGDAGECRAWAVAPLSPGEFLPPPVGRGEMLWVPHYNVPLLSRAPLVVTLHDILPLSPVAAHWPWAKRLVARAWLAAIRSRAARVLCSSAFTRDEVVRLAGIDASRIDVVPLGVDLPASEAERPRDAEQPPYLLFVGMVKPHKNLVGLLRAFESVAASIPHRLVVVGRHTGLRDVDAAALGLAARLAPRVELVEDAPNERLDALLAGADLLVQPSYYEGFGFPPLEAMAAGTPVVSSTAASLPEVCGDAALYFDPDSPARLAERILEVLGDAGLRARLRERGFERARSLPWNRCVEKTSEVILEALRAAKDS